MEKYFGLILVLCAIGGFLSVMALPFFIVYDTVKLNRQLKEECERIDAKWNKIKQERIDKERLDEEKRKNFII